MQFVTVLPGDTDMISAVRELFLEYQESLGIDFCFQGFEEELATLPGKYGPPDGRLILVYDDADLVACGALRPLGDGIAELKRIYIRPRARRRGLGRKVSEELIAFASTRGYQAVRLDTLKRLSGASELYENLGFTSIPPYNDNPIPDVTYMEKKLFTT